MQVPVLQHSTVPSRHVRGKKGQRRGGGEGKGKRRGGESMRRDGRVREELWIGLVHNAL